MISMRWDISNGFNINFVQLHVFSLMNGKENICFALLRTNFGNAKNACFYKVRSLSAIFAILPRVMFISGRLLRKNEYFTDSAINNLYFHLMEIIAWRYPHEWSNIQLAKSKWWIYFVCLYMSVGMLPLPPPTPTASSPASASPPLPPSPPPLAPYSTRHGSPWQMLSPLATYSTRHLPRTRPATAHLGAPLLQQRHIHTHIRKHEHIHIHTYSYTHTHTHAYIDVSFIPLGDKWLRVPPPLNWT